MIRRYVHSHINYFVSVQTEYIKNEINITLKISDILMNGKSIEYLYRSVKNVSSF
jgi:hypothetical protein